MQTMHIMHFLNYTCCHRYIWDLNDKKKLLLLHALTLILKGRKKKQEKLKRGKEADKHGEHFSIDRAL